MCLSIYRLFIRHVKLEIHFRVIITAHQKLFHLGRCNASRVCSRTCITYCQFRYFRELLKESLFILIV